MIAQLALELLSEIVEGGPNVAGLGVRVERLAGNPQRPFDHREPADRAGVVLGDELQFERERAGGEPFQTRQLVLGLLANLVGDRHPPAGEGQVHRLRPRPST
jgi:hypothetical protein